VFFKLENYSSVRIKIAPYLKLPYVCKSNITLNKKLAVNQKAEIGFPETYKTILPFKSVKCADLIYRAYIRTKNNKILYYNCVFTKLGKNKHKLSFFAVDIGQDIYNPIESSKFAYYTDKNASLLIKVDDKFYIISRELYPEETISSNEVSHYVGIIDVDSGKTLYLEKKSDNLHLDLFYPIVNRIVPVLQINRSGVHVHLVDLITQQINTVSWTVAEFGRIIIDLINKDEDFKNNIRRKGMSPDNIGWIYDFRLLSEHNEDYSTKEQVKYLKGIKQFFSISIFGDYGSYSLLFLKLNIEYVKNNLKTYIDPASTTLSKPDLLKNVSYREHYKETVIFQRSIPISSKIPKIHLFNVLHSDQCYDLLYSPENGVALTNKELSIIWSQPKAFSEFLIYHHGKYTFIIKAPSAQNPVCFIVIETKGNTLYPFISKKDFKTFIKQGSKLSYTFYYPKTNDMLIFFPTFPKHFKYIFVIDLEKLSDKLTQLERYGCSAGQYSYVEDFMVIFDIRHLLSDIILRSQNPVSADNAIEVLGYYMDESSNALYITISYIANNTRYIGLLKCITSKGGITLKLVDNSPLRHVLLYKNKGIIDLGNLRIQRVHYKSTYNNN
jgi:hypothetical protein